MMFKVQAFSIKDLRVGGLSSVSASIRPLARTSSGERISVLIMSRKGLRACYDLQQFDREVVMKKSPMIGYSRSLSSDQGIYRRDLPAPAVEFASDLGTQIFLEAISQGYTKAYYKLISYYQTQAELRFCGLTSVSMILNALQIDPGKIWKGKWRWYDEYVLFGEDLTRIKGEGISFIELTNVARNNNVHVEAYNSKNSSIEEFREYVKKATSTACYHIVLSYNRNLLGQTGGGHYSPIGAYNEERDMVLILDVARFKYPAHWIPLSLLWKAMDTIHPRGFVLISRFETGP